MRRRLPLVLAPSIVAVTLLAAGCGGGRRPGVANLAAPVTTATTTTTTAPFASTGTPLSSGSPSEGGRNQFEMTMKVGVVDGEKFSSCMRKHGVPNYPDPNGQPTPAETAQHQQQALALSVCMRAHGIKDFPDPGNGGLDLHGGPGSDLDPHNPAFDSALVACQKRTPGASSLAHG